MVTFNLGFAYGRAGIFLRQMQQTFFVLHDNRVKQTGGSGTPRGRAGQPIMRGGKRGLDAGDSQPNSEARRGKGKDNTSKK